MRRAERLFRLIHALRGRSISRAGDLATQLEVSLRTVYRDISHLQASGLPIEGAAGVGYLLRPGFDLPGITFTFDQVDALAVGLSFVESTGDPALVAAAREARAKIQASLPQPEAGTLTGAPFFTLGRKNAPAAFADMLRKAVRKRQVLQMGYKTGEGVQTGRRVRPVAIWNLPDGWMFSGWCELRGEFRTFRFDRIVTLALTHDTYEACDATSLQAFMAMEECGAEVEAEVEAATTA